MFNKLKLMLNFPSLAKDSSLVFGLKVFGMTIGYMFTILVSNFYGAEVLGIYTLSFVFLQIVSTLGRLGVDTASVKFIAEYKEKKENRQIQNFYYMVLRIILPFVILLSLVAIFLSPYIAEYVFNKEYLAPYLQLISLAIVPYVFIFIHSESLRGLQKNKEYIILQNISTTFVASIFLSLAIFYTIKSTFLPLLVLVLAIYCTFFYSAWLWRKEMSSLCNGLQKISVDSADNLTYKKVFSVALPLTFTSYLAMIMGSSDIIMLGIFMTEYYVGVYSVVIKLSTMSLIVFMAVNTITVSKFSAYWGVGKLAEMKRLGTESTKLILYFSLPIFIIIWIFPVEILHMFGAGFEEGASALIVMTVGQFLFIIAGPVWQMLNMTNKQKVFFYFSLISAAVNILLNYILIPTHGIIGAAYATVTGGVVLNILCIGYIKAKFGILTMYIPLYKD
jgi:O-antigen/teichoic acid export membrane protein